MNKVLLWKELMKLSPTERIELAQDLWDSIAPDEMPPLSPDEIAELDRRIAEHERNPGRASPWEEVRARLWARYNK